MSKRIDKACKIAGNTGYKKFSKTALYIADKYFEFPHGGKDTIVMVTAIDMAIGARLMRPKYLITGMIIGSVGLFSTMVLVEKFQKK